MKLIGAISIYRQEVRPFTDKQIELVQNFAAQAVIAIENTRLLNELRAIAGAADGDLRGAEVISQVRRANLEPVFQAMLENAVRICDAKFGILYLFEGDGFAQSRMHGAPPAYAEFRQTRAVIQPGPRSAVWPRSADQTSWFTSPTCAEQALHRARSLHCRQSSSAARGPCSACRCSRMTS